MKTKVWKNLAIKTAIMLLLIIALITVCLYYAFYAQYHQKSTVVISLTVSIIFIVIIYLIIVRMVKNAERAIVDVEKSKTIAEETMRSIMNASPMSCHYWSRDFEIIDCNDAALKLFGFRNKKEYLKYWLLDRNPKYQPNGQLSEVMGKALLDEAFEKGRCTFTWTHRLPDGSSMPVDVTFVRVKSGDDYFVAGYTRDLRREMEMEERAGDLFHSELSGVYTKQYMEDRFSRIIRMLSRTSAELSVMMVSIDHYNKYLQFFGANEAFKCLQITANILECAARRADDFVTLHRDGDFMVVLPNTGKLGAQTLANKIIEEIRELKITHPNNSAAPFVTVSIGVTTGRVYHRQRASDYIMRTEEMLYIAKQSGRNRSSYADL